MNVHRVGELWGLMHELGKRVGESWRLGYGLEKQTEKPDNPKCAYKATGQPDPYPACGHPAEYCATEPISTNTYELRLYWLCRQHAELADAEENWGDSIGNLLEWERVLACVLTIRSFVMDIKLIAKLPRLPLRGFSGSLLDRRVAFRPA